MFELGGHVIDRVIAFLGRPTQVRPWLRHDTKMVDVEKDNTLAVFEYPSALAVIVSSARDAASHPSFELIGTDGSMMIDPMEPVPALRVYMREARGSYKKGSQELKLPPQPRFIRDFQELARAILVGIASELLLRPRIAAARDAASRLWRASLKPVRQSLSLLLTLTGTALTL
jgi:predicted dehydrogenase